jgi:hypothetical protein
MTLAAEKAYEHIGESRICSNYTLRGQDWLIFKGLEL